MARYMSDDTLDDLTMVMQRFQRSEDYCRPWHDRAIDWYKRYRSYRDEDDQPYKNNVFDRLTFTIVETHTARLLQQLFAVEPFGSVVGIDNEADYKVAKQVERVLQVINGNPDRELFLEYLEFIKQNAIYGLSYLNVYPVFDLDIKRGLDMDNPYFFRGVGFTTQDMVDYFPDPMGKRISRCRWGIKRTIVYHDELKEKAKNGVFDPKIVKRLEGGNQYIDNEVAERLSAIGYSSFDDYNDCKTNKVEILEYFQDGHVITVAGRQEILRNTKKKGLPPLPYHLPVIDIRFCPQVNEFFSIGIPEILSDDQDYINTIRSARLDNIELCINKLFKLKENSTTDPAGIVAAPGNIMLVEQMDDLEEFKITDVTQSSYQEEDAVRRQAQDSAGEQEYGRGVSPERRETATGIIRLQEAGMVRHDIHIKLHEYSGVRQLLKKEMQIIREFMPQSMYERILNEKDAGFYEMSLDDIFNLYDIRPAGSSVTSNKELRMQNVMQAHGILSNMDPNMTMQNETPFLIDLYELTNMVLDELQIKNKADLVKRQEVPPPQPQQQQGAIPPDMMAQMGQGMMPPQGMPPQGGPMMPPLPPPPQ